MYKQLEKNNHIIFSFKENGFNIRLQREYVHALNKAMLQYFTSYTVRPTRKVHKTSCHDEYEYEYEAFDETGCRPTKIMYYISVFPKEKHKRSKQVWTIAFLNNDITIRTL